LSPVCRARRFFTSYNSFSKETSRANAALDAAYIPARFDRNRILGYSRTLRNHFRPSCFQSLKSGIVFFDGLRGALCHLREFHGSLPHFVARFYEHVEVVTLDAKFCRFRIEGFDQFRLRRDGLLWLRQPTDKILAALDTLNIQPSDRQLVTGYASSSDRRLIDAAVNSVMKDEPCTFNASSIGFNTLGWSNVFCA